MLAQSLLRCQHRSSVLRTFRSRVVCQGLLSSGRSISSAMESTCVNRVGSSSFVRRFNYGKIALGSKKIAQGDDLQQRLQHLEKEVGRQSQTVAQLQNDVMNLLRNEVARLTEERSPRQSVSPLQTVLRSAEQTKSSSNKRVQFTDGKGMFQSAAEPDRLDIGERLGDLESQLGQLLTSIGVYGEAVASQQLHFDRLERFVLDYKGGIERSGDKEEIVDRLNTHLRSLLEGLERERTAHSAAVTEILSRLDGIESRIRAQEAVIARLSGRAGVVRVGNWDASAPLGFAVPWLSGAPYSPIYANSSFHSLRTILDETLGIEDATVKVEFQEEDAMLDELISIGVPGALWHASSELVDDHHPSFSAIQDSFASSTSSSEPGPTTASLPPSEATNSELISCNHSQPTERTDFDHVKGNKPRINGKGGGRPGIARIVAEVENTPPNDQSSAMQPDEGIELGVNVPIQTSTPAPTHLSVGGVEDRVHCDTIDAQPKAGPPVPLLAQQVDTPPEPFIEGLNGEVNPTVARPDVELLEVSIKDRWPRCRSFDGNVMPCRASPSVEIHPPEPPRLVHNGGDGRCGKIKHDPEEVECGSADAPNSGTPGCGGGSYRCVLGIGPRGEAPESSDDLVETTSVCCGDAVVDMPTPRDLDDDELMYLLELSDVEEDVGSCCDEAESPRSPKVVVSLDDGALKAGGVGDGGAAEEVALTLTVEGFAGVVASGLVRSSSGKLMEGQRLDNVSAENPMEAEMAVIGIPTSSAENGGVQGGTQQESFEAESPVSLHDREQSDRDLVLRIRPRSIAEMSSVFENPLFEESEGVQWGCLTTENNPDKIKRWVNPLFSQEKGVPLLLPPPPLPAAAAAGAPLVESPECHIESSTRWVSFHDVSPPSMAGSPTGPSLSGVLPLDEKIALRW